MTKPNRHPARLGWGTALLLCGGLLAGCADEREAPAPQATWQADVQPLVQERCVSCHGGEDPAAGYSLESYLGALATGEQGTQPNARAGDPGSPILAVFQREDHHQALCGTASGGCPQLELLERWVVRDRLAYFRSGFHGAGILNPRSDEFHGELVREQGWTMGDCRQCHGEDYAGGAFGVSCNDCHAGTPESCATCHGTEGAGAPPPPVHSARGVGVHTAHLQAPSGRFDPVACATCHVVPDSLDAPGHVDNADDRRAEVVFDGLAVARGAEPAYAPESQQCSSTYCHGTIPDAQVPDPAWDQVRAAASCDACHGFPPATTLAGAAHPQIDQCSACHQTVGPDNAIVAPELHMNGTPDLLAGQLSCGACHSSPAEPLPFRDALGRTDPQLDTVGAHNAHVGPGEFHAEDGLGYACTTCHLVPDAINAPGHLDGDVDFEWGVAATGNGRTTPSYDPATGTCSSVWCHGSGMEGGQEVTPAWDDRAAVVACGSCHGLPPEDETHDGVLLTQCSGCHLSVIGPGLEWRDISLHANGTVEVF